MDNLWERNSPEKQTTNSNPIEVVYLDSSNSTDKQTPEIIHLESTPNNETESSQNVENVLVEGDQLNNINKPEENEGGPPSSISDIHPRDFFDPSEFWSQNSLLRGGGFVMDEFQKEHQWSLL